MNTRDEPILERIARLVTEGVRLSEYRYQSSDYGLGSYGREFEAGFAGWRAQATACVLGVVGEQSPYFQRLVEELKSSDPGSAAGGAAILTGLSADIRDGYLRRQADLVASEVFSDFLDMAGYLLEGGYFHAAASLTGAVAEDGLRRIARNEGVPVKPRDDMNALSSRLRERGVFTPLVAKRVTLWAEVRNHADHGEFDLVQKADVEEMYKGVTAFLAERLG